MRFDLRDQLFDRALLGGAIGARRQRLARQAAASRARDKDRRAKRQQQPARRAPRRAGATAATRAALRLRCVGRGEQPARDFDPRGLGFGLADQAGGAVARDLVELIAIDRDVAARPRRGPRRRASGHSTAKIAAAVISASKNQSVMAALHHAAAGRVATADTDVTSRRKCKAFQD